MLTQQELKSILHYDHNTGIFIWLKSPSRNIKSGSRAGSFDKFNGYHFIRINKIKYGSHRLAFLYMDGFMPDMVDHKNQIKDDNKWLNLRSCTNQQNQYNKSLQKNNKTGFKGVSFCKKNHRYRAQTRLNGVNKTIGYFETAELASEAYIKYNEIIHKEFGFYPNHTFAR